MSFELLVALARSAPNLVTLDQLAERVWPGLKVTPDTVSHRVKLVRDALGDDSCTPICCRCTRPWVPHGGTRSAARGRRSATQPDERHERSQAPLDTLSQPSSSEPVRAPPAAVPVDATARHGRFGRARAWPSHITSTIERANLAVIRCLTAVDRRDADVVGTRKADSAGNPLANARFSRLAGFEGVGRAAAISRDGKFVAFLANREGRNDVWVSEVGSGTYRNLTRSEPRVFTSPREIRTLGFSPDSSLVSIWTRSSDGSRPEDVNILAVPTQGGPLRTYLPEVAEYDWSHDGRKLVFHTTAPGDPIFVREPGSPDRLIYVARAGVHCHFPVWSPDDAFIYFARGIPTVASGISGVFGPPARGSSVSRLTTHTWPTRRCWTDAPWSILLPRATARGPGCTHSIPSGVSLIASASDSRRTPRLGQARTVSVWSRPSSIRAAASGA